MSMIPFLDHVEQCPVCRKFPRNPCAKGFELFQRGSEALVRRLDPTRAKA